MQTTTSEYKVYPFRFYIAFVLFLLNVSNSILWLSFSPIPQITSDYFGFSISIVNLLTVVFYIAYPLTSLFSSYFLDQYGLFWGMMLGSGFTFMGSWIRYFSTLTFQPSTALLFIGQIMAALGQPFLLNAPTKMAAVWFSPKERATANMVATLGNPIGGAVANIIVPAMVSTPHDIAVMLLATAVIATITCLPIFFVKKQPATPPSASAKIFNESTFIEGLKSLFKNPQFLLLALIFSVGVAIFNTLASLLNQIFFPFGYSDTEAGYFSAALIFSGLLGALCFGFLLDRYKMHVFFVRIILPLLSLISLSFFFSLGSGRAVALGILVGLFGFFCFSLLPVGLELAVEMTFPIDEALSSGVCWMGGNALSPALVYGVAAFAQVSYPNDPSQSLRWGCLIFVVLLFFLSIVCQFIKSKNLRMAAESNDQLSQSA